MAACLMAGISGSRQLRKTVFRREELCRMLSMIEFELARFKTPLPELFTVLETELDGEAASLCRRVGAGLSRLGECDFSTLWAEGLSFLPEEEERILRTLGSVLGRYGAEEQTQAVGLCHREMELAKDEARVQAKEKGRVYIALSAAGGAMLCVLLL